MSREIKFRAWDKTLFKMFEPRTLRDIAKEAPNNGVNWYQFEMMQFTGVEDYDGKPIFEGDILNICFTSDSGTFIHDGIYTAGIDTFNGVNFRFNDLSWIDHGHNQYPMNMDLNSSNKLGSVYAESGDKRFLYVADKYASDCEKPNSYPFNDEKELRFHSRYFKIIGNICEHGHLLKG